MGRADQGRQAGRFAPRAIGTLLRRFNHMSYLGGPKSLPHSFINSDGPDLDQNCLQVISRCQKSPLA